MIRVGIIGTSPQNGHPYSFSAILNGFCDDEELWQPWIGIYNYLKLRKPHELAEIPARVTHVWTQNREESQSIASCCNIPNVVASFTDMIGHIDAAVIARDDYQSHKELAEPFLRSGIPTFIDKPLSLRPEDLEFFAPYLKSGQLMTCSGLFYAAELHSVRDLDPEKIKMITATVLMNWERYAIHMLDAIQAVRPFRCKSVYVTGDQVTTGILKTTEGFNISLTTIGVSAKTFQIQFWTDDQRRSVDINDNFSAFKMTLKKFVEMVETKNQPINPDWTLHAMKILIAGQISMRDNKEVFLDEI